MKIIVLHGDDERKLYERLTKFVGEAKKRSWEVAYLDNPTISIQEQLSSSTLFGAERFFVIRDVAKLGKKELGWLDKKSRDLPGNLIIYHEDYISPVILKALPAKYTKIEEFKLPVLIWKFLEGLSPGNSKNSIRTFHKIIEKDPPEFIFSLIARHFRDLYWVKTDASSTGFPSWKVGKLKSQSNKFTEDKLREIINQLSDIDIEVKTSKADLVSSLDLLILKQLE
jgi:DNA polymerase III delta subunit